MNIQEKQRGRKLELKKLNLLDQIEVIEDKLQRLQYTKEQLKEQIQRIDSEMALLLKQDEEDAPTTPSDQKDREL